MRPYRFERNTFIQSAKEHWADRIEVEVGDIKQDTFLPQVKIKRWDNEVNLSVRYIDDQKGSVQQRGDILTYLNNKIEAHLYEKPEAGEDGGYEFEVILNEIPKHNVLSFSIETKGLDFFYQGELTEEEIAQGTYRPENVIGSYAVYHQTQKNNKVGGKEYKTGKFCHIYRPKIWDKKGNWTWGLLNIDVKSKRLYVTVPQEFLNSAVYPVVVDPTFGYTSIGGSGQDVEDEIEGSLFSLGEDGDVSQITGYYSRSFNATADVKNAIYTSGGTLVTDAVSNEISLSDADWYASSFSVSIPLVSGSYYLTAFGGNEDGSGIQRINYDTGLTNQGFRLSLTYETNSYPSTLSGKTDNDDKHSIYATYTAAAATETLTHTTDTLIQSTETASHSTDTYVSTDSTAEPMGMLMMINRVSQNTATHTTDTLVQSTETATHTTDTLVYEEKSLSHTTDTLVKEERTASHSTDTLVYEEATLSHETDTLVYEEKTATHTTDTLVYTENTLTHTADTLVYAQNTLSHATDTLVSADTSVSHTTDTLVLATLMQSHTTDTLVKEEQSLSHTTDTLVWEEQSVTHTTDTLVQATETLSHTTDTYVVERNALTHDTDTLVYEEKTLTHTTDTLVKATTTASHSTDTFVSQDAQPMGMLMMINLVEVDTHTLSHTTDTFVWTENTATHTTDTLVQSTETAEHTTDTYVAAVNTLSHSTDTFVCAPWENQAKNSSTWTNEDKNASSWTNTDKNSATWTNKSKNSSTWTNENKNSSTWTNEDKSNSIC